MHGFTLLSGLFVFTEPNPEANSWLGQSNYFREVWETRHTTSIGIAVRTNDSLKDVTEHEQSPIKSDSTNPDANAEQNQQ